MIHASAALSSPAPGGGRPEVRYRLVPAAGFVLTLVLWPPSGLGQSTRHGTIVGYVSGQTGRPLEGIKVMASAPAQTGSAKIAYSDQKGAFRLRQSRRGTFELRFTGADLKTLVRRGILVTPGPRPRSVWSWRSRSAASRRSESSTLPLQHGDGLVPSAEQNRTPWSGAVTK
jgi:hypothetical protein